MAVAKKTTATKTVATKKATTKKLRYGIVGCGGIAGSKHYSALSTMKNQIEVVAFCDIIEERAVKLAERLGTPDAVITTDYKKLVKMDLDVVLVLTPNKSHAPISIAALEAGKHVMCEKPMAKTYAEAKKMCEAAKKSKKLLTIAYQNRYRQDSLTLKKIIENGELGEVYYAKAHAVRRRGVPTWGVFTDEEQQGGGPLIDIGTHALDLTLWMMNNYKPDYVVGSVFKKLAKQTETGNCFGEWNPKEFTVEDAAMGYIVMKDGSTINLESSWALNTLDEGEAQTTLCGTLAGADMKDGLRVNKAHAGKLTMEKFNCDAGSVPFFEGASTTAEGIEAQVFYSAITKGTPLTVLPEQALVVTQILEAIYESGKTKKPVYFK